MWCIHLEKIDRSATDYVSAHHLGLILEQLASRGQYWRCSLTFGMLIFTLQIQQDPYVN